MRMMNDVLRNATTKCAICVSPISFHLHCRRRIDIGSIGIAGTRHAVYSGRGELGRMICTTLRALRYVFVFRTTKEITGRRVGTLPE